MAAPAYQHSHCPSALDARWVIPRQPASDSAGPHGLPSHNDAINVSECSTAQCYCSRNRPNTQYARVQKATKFCQPESCRTQRAIS